MRVKNKVMVIGFALMLILIGLYGCEDTDYPSFAKLPENHIEFEMYEWQSQDVEEDGCLAFDYNGRTYLLYSSNIEVYSVFTGKGFRDKDVDECLGCCVIPSDCSSSGGEVQEDERVLSLAYSEADDYLLVFYVPRLMAPPTTVYRAMDTRGKEIDTPDFIKAPDPEDPMHKYWQAE